MLFLKTTLSFFYLFIIVLIIEASNSQLHKESIPFPFLQFQCNQGYRLNILSAKSMVRNFFFIVKSSSR